LTILSHNGHLFHWAKDGVWATFGANFGGHWAIFFTKNIRGRCYDNNYQRFSTIFGEKIGVYSQKPIFA
jgi:hypothetical protein